MKRLLLTLLVLFWIGTFIYIILGSQTLKLSQITIAGNNYVPTEPLETLSKPLLDKHVISILFTNSISKQIREKYPQISDIQYKIQWPNTLQITIIEKPEWAVFVANNEDQIVAEDGTVLNSLTTNYHIQSVEKLIIVRGIHPNKFQNNRLHPETVTAIKSIRKKIEGYQQNVPIQYQFNQIHELSIIYNDELTIKLGKLEHIEEKFKQLHRFLKINQKPYNQIHYIDLRIPRKVVVNYALES